VFGQLNPVRLTSHRTMYVQVIDLLYEQCKRYKAGKLSDYHIKTLSATGVQFEKQRNVVGKQYMVETTIFAIHKFEREHGHIKVKSLEDPHLYHWIIHAKAVSAAIVEQGYGNDKFTLPHLFTSQTGAYSPTSRVQTETRTNGEGYQDWQYITVKNKGAATIKKTTTHKMNITKVAATRASVVPAPTKMMKMTQKVPAIVTHSSRSNNKPSGSVLNNPFPKCHPALSLSTSIISTTTPNVPDVSPVHVPVAATAVTSTVWENTSSPHVTIPDVTLPNIMLPNIAHPVGTHPVSAATRRLSDEEVKNVSRLQCFSHTSSPTPPQEDY
jgi:hypothetical protein